MLKSGFETLLIMLTLNIDYFTVTLENKRQIRKKRPLKEETFTCWASNKRYSKCSFIKYNFWRDKVIITSGFITLDFTASIKRWHAGILF